MRGHRPIAERQPRSGVGGAVRRPEQNLHRSVAQFLDLVLPADCWWTTIPLGGGGRIRGAILKSMGAKSGTPDILIVYRGKAYFIELKTTKGTESGAQKLTAAQISMAGARRAIARSIEGVAWALEVWNIPTKVAA